MTVVNSGMQDAAEGGITRRVRDTLAGEPGWMSSHGYSAQIRAWQQDMSMVWKRSIGTLLGVGAEQRLCRPDCVLFHAMYAPQSSRRHRPRVYFGRQMRWASIRP